MRLTLSGRLLYTSPSSRVSLVDALPAVGSSHLDTGAVLHSRQAPGPMTLLEDTTLTWFTAVLCSQHSPCQTSASVILFHMVLGRPQLVYFPDEEQNILRGFNP
jgi:hypothetical protein